jgi:hypothetical protein
MCCARSIVVSEAGDCTKETKQLLVLWRKMEQLRIWSPFVEAAVKKDYESLKGMADVFCHLD